MKKLIALLTLIILFSCTSNRNPKVFISTEMGDIIVELYADKAPITTANFLQYVDSEKFNGEACFYRVVRPDNQPNNPIKIEVVQGGFATDSLIEKKQLLPIKHETTKETGILHKNGTISMARLEPGTASSEFFICIGDQPELDFGGKRNPDGQGFAAFGSVIEGMDVIKKIQQLEDNDQYLKKPVFIIEILRL
ncbi:MAG: peptidylprolyl isomerase [Bacteroidales bacterium]|jgi:peptidyl-prolyl cis-trans isomerase A (cyclophilin A)|nr:peptidylprolyl isomerase [Bacteroidales bacterium]